MIYKNLFTIRKNLLFVLLTISYFFTAVDCHAEKLISYTGEEVKIYVTPGEPSELIFPNQVAGGYLKKPSALRVDRKESSLVLFSKENLDPRNGEAMLVKLKDDSSFSLRILRSNKDHPREATIRIQDIRDKDHIIEESDQSGPTLPGEKEHNFASPNQVSGLVREMILVSEYGLSEIKGYNLSEAYKGQPVLNDGALDATIDKIYTGSKYWGYVLNVTNLLSQNQRINPGTFRLDGTRAISAERWELAPQPLNTEQMIANKHTTKLYIVTKAR